MLCQCNQLQAFSVRQLETAPHLGQATTATVAGRRIHQLTAGLKDQRTWQLQRLLGAGRQNTACIRRHRHGWAGTPPSNPFNGCM